MGKDSGVNAICGNQNAYHSFYLLSVAPPSSPLKQCCLNQIPRLPFNRNQLQAKVELLLLPTNIVLLGQRVIPALLGN